jgi:hypothetical protein
MFFMPLAYPSSLDRRPPVAHIRKRSPSYVEGLWSPSLARRLEKRRLKLTLIASVPFQRAAPRVFLSQAGPRFVLERFKLSITCGSDVD